MRYRNRERERERERERGEGETGHFGLFPASLDRPLLSAASCSPTIHLSPDPSPLMPTPSHSFSFTQLPLFRLLSFPLLCMSPLSLSPPLSPTSASLPSPLLPPSFFVSSLSLSPSLSLSLSLSLALPLSHTPLFS